MKNITIIKWIDSAVQNDQVDIFEFPRPMAIHSVGFIVEETEDYLVLARDDMSNGQFRGLCAIPKILIRERKD